MALPIKLPAIQPCLYYSLISFANNYVKRYVSYTTAVPEINQVQVDVIDEFTTQLMQKKCCKWNYVQERKHIIEERTQNVINEVIHDNNNESYLTRCLQYSLEQNDLKQVKKLMGNYLLNKRLPPEPHLFQILSLYAQTGEKDNIVEISNLCQEIDWELYENQSSFKHYLASAIWIKGNIGASIEIFEEIYSSKPNLRRTIRLMLKNLIVDSIENGSEAILINIRKLCERISRNYGDFYLLAILWQSYISSNLFCDQSLAIELLNESDELCKFVTNRIPYIVTKSLHNHQVDVVYRLLEVLLSKNVECAPLLIALFNYKLQQGDLQGCTEIIRWSSIYGISLPGICSNTKSTKNTISFKF